MVGLLLAACGGSPSSPSPDGSTTITITSAGVSATQVTVSPGSRVSFINNDTRSHNMTSDPHPEHNDCPEINTVGLLQPGERRETGNLIAVRTCGFMTTTTRHLPGIGGQAASRFGSAIAPPASHLASRASRASHLAPPASHPRVALLHHDRTGKGAIARVEMIVEPARARVGEVVRHPGLAGSDGAEAGLHRRTEPCCGCGSDAISCDRLSLLMNVTVWPMAIVTVRGLAPADVR
jgi:hypothetical protein